MNDIGKCPFCVDIDGIEEPLVKKKGIFWWVCCEECGFSSPKQVSEYWAIGVWNRLIKGWISVRSDL